MDTRQKIIIVLTSGTIPDEVLAEYSDLFGLSKGEKEVVGTFSYGHNQIGLYFPSEYQQKVVELIKSGKVEKDAAYTSYYETDSDTGQGVLAPVEYWKEVSIDGNRTRECDDIINEALEVDLEPSLGFNLDNISKGYAQMISGFESELNDMRQSIPKEIQAYHNDENFEEIKKNAIEKVINSQDYKKLVDLQNHSKVDPEEVEKKAQELQEQYELEKTNYFFENKIPINADTIREYDAEEGRLNELQKKIDELSEASIPTEKQAEIKKLEKSIRNQTVSIVDQQVDYDFASLAAISQKKKEFLSSLKEVLDEGDLQAEGPTQPNSLLLDVMSSPSESETNNESSSETENSQEFDETLEVLSEVQTNDTQPENPTPGEDEVDSSTNAADFIEEDRLPEIPKEEPLEEAEEVVDLGDLDASLNNEDAEQFGVSGFRALEGEPVIKEEKSDIENGEEEMKQEEHTEEQERGLDGWFDTKNTPTEKEEVVAPKTEEPSEEEKTPKKPNKQVSKKGLVGKFNKLEKKEKIFFGVAGAVGVIMLIFGISTVLSISKALNAPKDNSIKSEKVESKSSKTKSDSSSSKSKSKTSKSSDGTDSNKKYKLSKSQYEDYVNRLSALSGIYINSDGGLGGELKFSDGSTRRIKKFTRDGELIVVDEDKKETTFDKKWVDGLLARLEAEGTSSKESGQSEESTDKPKEGAE
jgi:hypothetical protein